MRFPEASAARHEIATDVRFQIGRIERHLSGIANGEWSLLWLQQPVKNDSRSSTCTNWTSVWA
jgi:hypothetical protein